MQSTNTEDGDYHVNTQFRIGGTNSIPQEPRNIASTQPSTVAPATLRMMGKQNNYANNHEHGVPQSTQYPQYAPNRQRPLMPPVNLSHPMPNPNLDTNQAINAPPQLSPVETKKAPDFPEQQSQFNSNATTPSRHPTTGNANNNACLLYTSRCV